MYYQPRCLYGLEGHLPYTCTISMQQLSHEQCPIYVHQCTEEQRYHPGTNMAGEHHFNAVAAVPRVLVSKKPESTGARYLWWHHRGAVHQCRRQNHRFPELSPPHQPTSQWPDESRKKSHLQNINAIFLDKSSSRSLKLPMECFPNKMFGLLDFCQILTMQCISQMIRSKWVCFYSGRLPWQNILKGARWVATKTFCVATIKSKSASKKAF